MITVNIHEAKTHLSKLLQDVMRGQEVIIAKSGIPIAILKPIAVQKPKRKPGLLKGKITIAHNFDESSLDESTWYDSKLFPKK